MLGFLRVSGAGSLLLVKNELHLPRRRLLIVRLSITKRIGGVRPDQQELGAAMLHDLIAFDGLIREQLPLPVAAGFNLRPTSGSLMFAERFIPNSCSLARSVTAIMSHLLGWSPLATVNDITWRGPCRGYGRPFSPSGRNVNLEGRAPGGRDSASLEECPHAVVRKLNPCTERRTAVSQESREPGRGIDGSRFRLSCIGTIRVDEVPGWAESGQYITVH